jgi:hypothetical protein
MKEGGYILLYQYLNNEISYFLVKAFDSEKDYEIPGGKLELTDKTRLLGAIREFGEETGYYDLPSPNDGDYIPLGLYRGAKKIKFCYALEWSIPQNYNFTSNLKAIRKKGGKIEEVQEIVSWKWFIGLNKLQSKPIEPAAQYFIKKLKNYLQYINLHESQYFKLDTNIELIIESGSVLNQNIVQTYGNSLGKIISENIKKNEQWELIRYLHPHWQKLFPKELVNASILELY